MIQFEGVAKTYQSGKQEIHALNGIDLTVETGEMTPTMKVKRKVISENNKAIIEGLYK